MDSNSNSANMKLEPGMMCLVIGGLKNLDNIGKTVKLVRFLKKGEYLLSDTSVAFDVWDVLGENLTLMRANNTKVRGNISIVCPKHLMPIRPEEDPLEMSMQSIEDYLDSKQKEKA